MILDQKLLVPNLSPKGVCCDPGDNIGVYINAYGGIRLGDNVNIGPNSILTSTNHDQYDHRKLSATKGITIGNNVWIGGNCSILAGSSIGDNVTIGAGCVIHGNIPSNTLVLMIKPNLSHTEKRSIVEFTRRKFDVMGIIQRQGLKSAVVRIIGICIGAVTTIFFIPALLSVEDIGLIDTMRRIITLGLPLLVLGGPQAIRKYFDPLQSTNQSIH